MKAPENGCVNCGKEGAAALETFDFIIVGAGSAGCVLAERLTASGAHRVLLIEAGGDDNKFWIKVPLGYGKTYDDPAVNWCYTAQADAGLNQRHAFWPRGRVIGGSSSINAMAHVHGLPHDFDDWEDAGAKGWNWANVRETYAALETQDEFDDFGKRRRIGNGPIYVSELTDRMHPFSQHFLDAAREAGWPVRKNLNAEARAGIAPLRGTVKHGRRWSAADAFLRPARRRSNLQVVTHAMVQRIELDGRRVTGVTYQHQGRSTTATATREVIVSAGAINSPQLLQISGIGPVDVLRRNGVEVRHALSQVGQGLQDHLAISYQFEATEPTLNNRLGNWLGKMVSGMKYLMTRNGPLSVPINQVGGFVSSQNNKRPDLQIYCNPMSYRVRSDGKPDVAMSPGFLLSAQPCRPTSRGEVTIASSDPAAAPEIKPNSLSTAEDRSSALKAARTVHRLATMPSIRAVTRSAPDLDHQSDDAVLEDFRARAASVYHASCTCRMGDSADTSVLDNRLRVHGLAGLRVIDASSFPNVTSGNTNAPVMMLAARGADMILEDAAQPIRHGGAL